MASEKKNWREHGVKIIPSAPLDLNTAQTPGMTRAAAITHARTGANKLWAGTVTIHPDAKTGPHHHFIYGQERIGGGIMAATGLPTLPSFCLQGIVSTKRKDESGKMKRGFRADFSDFIFHNSSFYLAYSVPSSRSRKSDVMVQASPASRGS